jgi:hypothetical protein
MTGRHQTKWPGELPQPVSEDCAKWTPFAPFNRFERIVYRAALHLCALFMMVVTLCLRALRWVCWILF